MGTEYFYDPQGRLTECKKYYNDGIHIYSSTRFVYQTPTTTRVEYWVNKMTITGGFGFPSTNDLILYRIETFTPTNSGAVLTKTNEKGPDNPSSDYRDEYGLGFNSFGQLVWEVRTNRHGLTLDYHRYTRDERGNTTLDKYRNNFDQSRSATTNYEYDQQKNPYYTTGDISDQRAANPNNILRERFLTNQGGKNLTEYQYEYRMDGYPAKVILIRTSGNSQTSSDPLVFEFSYNK